MSSPIPIYWRKCHKLSSELHLVMECHMYRNESEVIEKVREKVIYIYIYCQFMPFRWNFHFGLLFCERTSRQKKNEENESNINSKLPTNERQRNVYTFFSVLPTDRRWMKEKIHWKYRKYALGSVWAHKQSGVSLTQVDIVQFPSRFAIAKYYYLAHFSISCIWYRCVYGYFVTVGCSWWFWLLCHTISSCAALPHDSTYRFVSGFAFRFVCVCVCDSSTLCFATSTPMPHCR